MFGNENALHDAVPNHFVDYREKMSSDRGVRYTDRLYPDGTWEPDGQSRRYMSTSERIPIGWN